MKNAWTFAGRSLVLLLAGLAMTMAQANKRDKLTVETTEAGSRLASLTMGGAGVWGVNGKAAIYYRVHTYGDPLYTGTDWQEVEGQLVQVDAGDNTVWGVNADGKVYHRVGITADNPGGLDWEATEGKLRQVTVSPRGFVWGVNADQKVYYREDVDCSRPGGRDWQQVEGLLVQISAGYAGVWGVNKEGRLYYRNATYGDTGSKGDDWILVDNRKDWIHVASGDAIVVAADKGGNVWKRTKLNHRTPTGTTWVKLSGLPKKVTVVDTASRDLWALDANQVIYHVINI